VEMINNSLTVKIEDDLYETTGKGVSNIANRYSYQKSNQSSPNKIQPKKRSVTGNKMSHNMTKKESNPIDFRLSTEFGISLGAKLFRNEKFE